MNYKNIILFITGCICYLNTFSQIPATAIEQFLSNETKADNRFETDLSKIKDFYSRLNYKTAWIQRENAPDLSTIINTLQEADQVALNQKDYQYSFFESLKNGTVQLTTQKDSVVADLCITDAAIHFFSDIVYGNTRPALEYYGLKYTPGCLNIPVLLADYIAGDSLPGIINKISPRLPEISLLIAKIKWIRSVSIVPDFKEVTITSNKVNNHNESLVIKLYQLGIIDSFNENIPDTTLKEKIREVQRQFGLLSDGVFRSTILQELNVPISVRLQQLFLAINDYRWLSCLQEDQSVIVVNIPAAYLKVYYQDKVILEMRMVVGKKSTPTPALSSTVDEVILYPYWHVPNKIATKELLPLIKLYPKYLDDNNFQVLNMSGKIVDPNTVNWHSLSRNYFPYILRQSTGCDNSLGLLKLNFYSPFGVYLHDTPLKSFFSFNKRYFSHACMRMEKPMELGHMVLTNNRIAIDTLEQKGCLLNQSPVIVPADVKMPLVVWYNPAGVDSTGRVLFFEDIYEKFSWTK